MKKTIIALAVFTVLCSSVSVFAKSKGYVRLYKEEDLKGLSVTIPFKKDISDLQSIGFNDEAKSVEYNIPQGWEAIIYQNAGFSKNPHILQGTGSIKDLELFNKEASSIEWRQH
jgi:hypothetical protein